MIVRFRMGVLAALRWEGGVVAVAQTNLDDSVQDLKIGLTGWTSGQVSTHGKPETR